MSRLATMTAGFWPDTVPGGPALRGAGTGGLDRETRERILDATDRLVRQFGMAKTSITDVARAADVARGTLYRYFDSRDVLFDALAQRTTDLFFVEVAAAMNRHGTLSDQVGEFSEMMVRSIHPSASADSAANQAAMVRMLSTQSIHALRRTAGFLKPYIEAAHQRGEVRAGLDIDDASEWLARSLLSFTIFQASVAYETFDPVSVRQFVQRYAVDGLAGRQ
jgi:AcrR family transcriptional regulator